LEEVDWIGLAQDRDTWWAVVNAGMNRKLTTALDCCHIIISRSAKLLLQEKLHTVKNPIIFMLKLLLIYQQLMNAFCKLITY
jgi:hypothetical protein